LEIIKIIHLITGNEGGGSEKMLEKLIKYSPEHHQHHVILLKSGNKLDVKNCYHLNFTKNPFKFLIEFIKLIKLFKQLRPNLAMSWLYHSDLLIFLVSKILNYPLSKILWNIRCSYLDLNDYSFITRLVLFLTTKISKNIGNIIFNSYSGKKYHHKLGYRNKNMLVIQNGFDLKKFKPNRNKKKLLKDKHNLKKQKIIGMIARNDPTKNFEIFTNLSNKISLDYPLNTKYLIAGKNTEKIKIPKKNQKLYLSVGYKRNIHEYYNILDVLVLISKGEGFSNVIGEAMCMNVPVVCNNVGDNKIIVENSGIVISKKPTIKELRKSLIKVLKCKKKYINGRAIITKKYKIDVIAKQYENLFNSVLDNKI
jgi:glycosyltransferase involved in cell wall biosynthesis